jgi:hypothetical protein
MIRSEREKKQAAGNQHHKPDQFIQATIARWRENQFQGFHERHKGIAEINGFTVPNPQSTSIIPDVKPGSS